MNPENLALIFAGLLLAGVAEAAPIHITPVPLGAPSVEITNGLIRTKIYVIDAQKGFYRGQRFDRAGVVGSLTYGGQEFYGPWFDRVSSSDMDNPNTPDGLAVGYHSAISGPVEEFAPSFFDEAGIGGTFLKIGVGRLIRPDRKDYNHARDYELVDPGKRSMIATASSIIFTQDVAGGYHYVKTLSLVAGKPQLRIEHVLTNTSTAPLISNVYDHNFVRLSPGNGDVTATFPFAITPDIMPNPALMRVSGHSFSFVHPLKGDERAAFLISGFGTSPSDYDIDVKDTKTGAGVRVTGDDRLVRLYTWSIRTVMAVEPFVGIDLKPGETKRWSYSYIYTAPHT